MTLNHGAGSIIKIMEGKKRLFTIGELSRQAGVNLPTIRFYEKRGLLFPAARKASGYRLYDEDSLKKLLFIQHGKGLGFTLKEIKDLLGLKVDRISVCEKVRTRAEAKLKDVKRRIAALESVERALAGLLESCIRRKKTGECPILKALEKE